MQAITRIIYAKFTQNLSPMHRFGTVFHHFINTFPATCIQIPLFLYMKSPGAGSSVGAGVIRKQVLKQTKQLEMSR